MKIKDTLDLCGWELWNFCIQNHQNLEGLLDLGAGRKVFYTGNDQGKNGREVIYDGSKWKVSAYISDVDELRGLITALENATDEEIEALKGRATTLEGRVDTIDNMLNVENSQTVVDTWEEVKKFLASVSEETDLITLLNGKANAGIENGKGYVALPYANNKQAFIFYNGGFEWSLTNEGWTGSHKILHQGNFANLIGDTYLKTDGSNAMTNGLRLYTFGSGSINVPTTDGVFIYRGPNTGGVDVSLPNDYTNVLNIGGPNSYSNLQLAWYRSIGVVRLHARVGEEKGYSAWKEILHEGNYSDLITTLNGNLSVGGNVGIGVDNPQNALDVNGNVDIKYMLSVGTHVLTPKIKSNTGIDITAHDGDASSSIFLDKGVLRPYSSGKNLIDLGSSTIRWKGVYSGTGDFSGNVTFNAELIGKTETGGSFARWRIATSGNGTFFQAGSVDSIKAQGVLYLSGINGTYLEKLNILSDLAVVSNKLHIGHIANDDGSALQINGDIHVTGNIIADGEVSAGGAGTEGNGGAGGFSLYESWGTSAPTEPLALGANLGYELKTRVEDLELAKTKVTFEPELVSGKPIGAITIDGNKTNLFAPATYAWSEIDGRPTNLSQFTDDVVSGKYLPLSGGTITGTDNYPLIIKSGTTEYSGIRFKTSEDNFITFGYKYRETDTIPNMFLTDKNAWDKEYYILHSGNFSGYAAKYDNGASIDAARHSIGYDNGTRGSENFPITADGGGYISFGHDSYGGQLLGQSNGLALYYRGVQNNVLTDWKTIAFTDSNVASARALQNTYDYASLDNTQLVSNFGITSYGLRLYGKDLYLQDNKGYKFIINTSGNVTIGGSNLAGTSAKLYVDGNISLGTTGHKIFWNNDPANFSIFNTSDGIMKYTSYYGHIFYSGMSERMRITSDGRVGIGTSSPAYKLTVIGQIFAKEQVYSDVGFILRTNDGKGSRASFSHSSNTLYIQSGYNDGSNVSGYMMLCGINTNHMASLEVRALKSAFDGRLIVGSTNDDGTNALQVNGTSAFYGSTTFGKEGVSMQVNFKCPVVAEDRVTIGGATLRWDDEIKALRLNTSLAATGELSAGGAGTEGGNTGGGGTGTIASPFSRTFTPNEKTSFTFSHDLPYYDVVVQVYEWDSSGMCWNMVLADIEIQNNDVTVTLGRMENVEHKIVVR